MISPRTHKSWLLSNLRSETWRPRGVLHVQRNTGLKRLKYRLSYAASIRQRIIFFAGATGTTSRSGDIRESEREKIAEISRELDNPRTPVGECK